MPTPTVTNKLVTTKQNSIYVARFLTPQLSVTGTPSAEFLVDASYNFLSIYATWANGVTAGKFRLKTAPALGYGGNWANWGDEMSFVDNSIDTLQTTAQGFLAGRIDITENVVGGDAYVIVELVFTADD